VRGDAAVEGVYLLVKFLSEIRQSSRWNIVPDALGRLRIIPRDERDARALEQGRAEALRYDGRYS